MKSKQPIKAVKADAAAPLTVNCTNAEKLVQAARKHLSLIKTEQKQARKALKQAKKARKRARLVAKTRRKK